MSYKRGVRDRDGGGGQRVNEPMMVLAWKIVSYEMMALFRKKNSYWGVMVSVMYSHQ